MRKDIDGPRPEMRTASGVRILPAPEHDWRLEEHFQRRMKALCDVLIRAGSCPKAVVEQAAFVSSEF
jgi:hypothetical protein